MRTNTNLVQIEGVANKEEAQFYLGKVSRHDELEPATQSTFRARCLPPIAGSRTRSRAAELPHSSLLTLFRPSCSVLPTSTPPRSPSTAPRFASSGARSPARTATEVRPGSVSTDSDCQSRFLISRLLLHSHRYGSRSVPQEPAASLFRPLCPRHALPLPNLKRVRPLSRSTVSSSSRRIF